MTPPDTLADRYYGALLGAWSGLYRVEITDPAALPTPVRLALLALSRLPTPRFSTTLARHDDHFTHTTRVTSLGLPLLASRESIVPGSDGRTVRLEGRMGALRGRPYHAEGEVEPDAQGARYRIPWWGVTLEQRLRVVEAGQAGYGGQAGLALEHRTPGSVARALLQRVR